jgi:hypothetical protein
MDHPEKRTDVEKKARSFFKPDSAGEIRRALSSPTG